MQTNLPTAETAPSIDYQRAYQSPAVNELVWVYANPKLRFTDAKLDDVAKLLNGVPIVMGDDAPDTSIGKPRLLYVFDEARDIGNVMTMFLEIAFPEIRRDR